MSERIGPSLKGVRYDQRPSQKDWIVVDRASMAPEFEDPKLQTAKILADEGFPLRIRRLRPKGETAFDKSFAVSRRVKDIRLSTSVMEAGLQGADNGQFFHITTEDEGTAELFRTVIDTPLFKLVDGVIKNNPLDSSPSELFQEEDFGIKNLRVSMALLNSHLRARNSKHFSELMQQALTLFEPGTPVFEGTIPAVNMAIERSKPYEELYPDRDDSIIEKYGVPAVAEILKANVIKVLQPGVQASLLYDSNS